MFPFVIRIMLAVSFLLILARSITIVFLPIYFHTTLHLEIDQIGYLLGGSLFFGTLLGIYGGYLIDVSNKKLIFSGAMGLSTTIFFLFPFIKSMPTLFVFLIILNFSFCLIEIAIKAFISEYLQQKDRIRAFSIGYVLRNIAFTMGPLIGVFVGQYNQNYVFFASSILCFSILCILISIKIENSYSEKKVIRICSLFRELCSF
jgi:MFS family permease